jgi:tetratricopeptide (TPR) repeat protein
MTGADTFQQKLPGALNRRLQALATNPLDKQALRNVADICYWQGRLADALPYFKAARYTSGAGLEYQLLLGQLYWRLEDTVNALREFEAFEAVAMQTDALTAENMYLLDGAAWLAEAIRWQGDLPRAHALALALCKKAAVQSGEAAARLFFPLAGLLRQTGEWALAEQLRRAAILRPELADRRLINRQATGLLSDGGDEWGLSYLMNVSRGLRINPPPSMPSLAGDKIHLGLVCQDVRDHPVGQYLRPLLQAYVLGHMPGVRIFLYNTGEEYPTDPVFGELRMAVGDDYRLLRGQDLAAIQKIIQADGIAVLCDLGGRSPRSHSFIFEARLAPRQILWLGWGHTAGNAGTDYVVADEFCAPSDTRFMHESQAVFPAPYMQIPKLPVLAADTRAPCVKNNYVTFGWPNRLDKITPACFDREAAIMGQLPNSKLLVMRPELIHEFIKNNIWAEFRKRGIEAARVLIVANTPQNYAENLRRIDVVLDPIAVNGGATSMDAIAHGVLVATQPGTQIYQRFTNSFLQHAGMGDWCFADSNAMIKGVVAKCRDIAGLAKARADLAERLPQSALMDRALFGHGWVSGLRQICAAAVQTKKPMYFSPLAHNPPGSGKNNR